MMWQAGVCVDWYSLHGSRFLHARNVYSYLDISNTSTS